MAKREISNKEAIEKLVAYFKENADFETVARALANMLIDSNRWEYLEHLGKDEVDSLCHRTLANNKMLRDFLKNGSKDKFCVANLQKE